jgi:predicted enzyme related to lactoylglutathione lyase
MPRVPVALAGIVVALVTLGSDAFADTDVAVGPQYDTTHAYVSADAFDACIASLIATFGGSTSPKGTSTVTPTPSNTLTQLALTPAGSVSVFGYRTPVPYPFGSERTGYLVTDLDAAIVAARAAGASVVVAPFADPIGRDAVILWPGGVMMQLYVHTTPPRYPALASIPENRVYVSPESADAFVRDFVTFSRGRIEYDTNDAAGEELGRPGYRFRRIELVSGFGRLRVLVTDGALPFPYGRETTGYEVADLDAALARAVRSGASVVAGPIAASARRSAIVAFPGGYLAELHTGS